MYYIYIYIYQIIDVIYFVLELIYIYTNETLYIRCENLHHIRKIEHFLIEQGTFIKNVFKNRHFFKQM